MSSSIQNAVAHILSEMERNGIEITDAIRDKARLVLMEKLFHTERNIFRDMMALYDTRKPTPPYTTKDLVLYQSGAFGLALFAPGGVVEVDGNGRPVPWEKPSVFPCNGDYWYGSGCGNIVETEGCYCLECQQTLKDNGGKWPREELAPCMSYCRIGKPHDGVCEPMEGR